MQQGFEMIQKEFKNLVFEFAKEVSGLDNVLSVFLYGSVARGEWAKGSDIDILVVISG